MITIALLSLGNYHSMAFIPLELDHILLIATTVLKNMLKTTGMNLNNR